MCGFIRRCSKSGITLSLIVLSIALCQISSRTDLSSSNRQPGGASGSQESSHFDPPVLGLGEAIDQVLPGGGSHYYKVTLNSGQYLRLLISPSGTQLATTLYAPDGQKVSQSTCRQNGPTPVSAIAEVSGTYRLELRSLEGGSAQGRYEVRVEAVRPATAVDTHRIAAEHAFADADELRNEWKAESSREAIRRYEEALQDWRTAGEQLQEAASLRNIGEIYHLLGEPRKAVNFYQQALAISKKANDPKGEAEALEGIAEVSLDLGENQRAMEYCGRALNLSRANDDRQGEAKSLSCIGKVHYVGFGNLRRSLEYFDQTLARSYSLSDRRGQADALYYLGFIYSELGEVQKASVSLNRALSLWRSLSDRRGEALTLIAMGHMNSWLGEKQQAFDLLNRALALVRPMGYKRWEATILAKLGGALFEMGEKQRSLDYYRDGLRLYKEINARMGEAALLADIGEIYYSSGQNQKALDHYYRALLLSRAVGDRQIEATVLGNMGGVYESLGQKGEALRYWNQALSLNRASGERRAEAYTLNNLGRLCQALGKVPESVDYYHRALLLSRETQDRIAEALALYNIARVERSRGHLTEARSRLEEALKIVESLRTKVASQELRSSYLASEHQRYDFYIDLLMQMHKERPSEGIAADALQASERARARSLVESLAEARADIRQGIDPTLLDRERSLQQGLRAKEDRQMQLANGKPDKQEAEALAKEIRELTHEYDQIQAEIKSKSPRYAALTQPQPLNLKQIQQQVLDDNSLLLEYALGEEHSYLWAVTKTGMTSHALPKRAEIERAARHLYELLIARQPKPGEPARQHQARVNEADAEYWPQAAALSKTLLGSVADQLGTKRLLIVAEGALQYLQFGALPKPRPDRERTKVKRESNQRSVTSDRDTPRSLTTAAPLKGGISQETEGDCFVPLIVEHEIVNLPSASALAVLRNEIRKRRPASKSVAVIADPVFESDDPRVAGAAGTASHSGTARDTGTPRNRDASKPRRRVAASPYPVTELQRALRDVGMLREGGLNIPRLLSSRQEAEAIIAAAAGAGMRATDFQASRATATSPELGQYRIVHFATHGLLNSDHPELSGLVLSLVNEQGKDEDGFLRLHDIYNLNLPADLVVLSACNTGLGKDVRGEGLVGIVRGFMYAGAARVVASLWKVDDEATAELMKRFYQQMLQRRLTPAAALRAAQVEMWQHKRWHSPYYWAAFVLQGEWK
jgi:tetratricopeptide (TPR) repeat protein